MNPDRISGLAAALTLGLHGILILSFGIFKLHSLPTPQMPLLLEVTLAGTSAPRSTTEGVDQPGEVIAPREEKADPATEKARVDQIRQERRRRIIRELTESRDGLAIGASARTLRRQQSEGLARGRGAGEVGSPGSSRGALSLSGAIASRGYKEPDFSALKSLITEETQLRVLLVVLPGGEVKNASLTETSGYPYLDQQALELARKIMFDPLPPDWKQVEQAGILTIKLKL